MADFKGQKRGKSHVQNMGIFFLVAKDMVLSHRAEFQLIINFLRVKAISTGLQGQGPTTQTQVFSKKKVLKNFFQAKKILKNFFQAIST